LTLTNFGFELGLLFNHYGMYEKALSLFHAYVSEKHHAESSGQWVVSLDADEFRNQSKDSRISKPAE